MKKVVILILLITVIIAAFFYFRQLNQDEHVEPTQAVFAWSGISRLPDWAMNTEVIEKGNEFSREFVITFSGTKEQIEQWVKSEPAISALEPLQNGNISTYSLNPQEGAQFAEVKIDHTTNMVTIRTYWS